VNQYDVLSASAFGCASLTRREGGGADDCDPAHECTASDHAISPVLAAARLNNFIRKRDDTGYAERLNRGGKTVDAVQKIAPAQKLCAEDYDTFMSSTAA
jgi:hypothetical protein